MAYADNSTDAKWLKTVDRNKRGPIVPFEISIFTLYFEHQNFTFQFLRVPLGKFFSQYTLDLFFLLLYFILFHSKKIAMKNSQYTLDFEEKKGLAIDCSLDF